MLPMMVAAFCHPIASNIADYSRKVFDHPVCGKDAAKQLLSLRQGAQSVAEMACEFHTLAAKFGWNEEALQGAFRNSLTESWCPGRSQMILMNSFLSLSALTTVSGSVGGRG
jgi:hypothetical protein